MVRARDHGRHPVGYVQLPDRKLGGLPVRDRRRCGKGEQPGPGG